MEPLIVPGTLDSLSAIGKYVLEAAAAASLEKKAAYRLRLAVDEIATNIVNYGYEPSGIEAPISIYASMDDSALLIVVEDVAPAFDPLVREGPDDLDQPLEQRRIGGLGIYLALTGVDKFTYERIGDRNRNSFMMYRPASA